MTVLLILGIVVLALVLLSLVRVGVRVQYAQDRPEVRLLAGPVRITLYPRKAKGPGRRQRKRAKSDQAPGEKGKLPPLEELIPLIRQLLPLGLEAAGRLRRKIRIDFFFLDVTVASADPARAAVNYGRLNGAIGMFWPLVEQNCKVKQWRIRTWVDFTAVHPTVCLRTAATLTVGQLLALGIWAAVNVLPILSKFKQPEAGAASRHNTEKEAV